MLVRSYGLGVLTGCLAVSSRGINPQETPEDALYRELNEEVGLERHDVQILACTRGWLRYRLPQRLVRTHSQPLCIGQKQNGFSCA